MNDASAQKKIKVVMGITDFRIGGAQRLVVNIAPKFNRERFDVELVTLMQFEGYDTFYSSLPDWITVHKLHFRGFADATAWMRLLRLLWRVRPDVVWSQLFFSNVVFRVLKPLAGYRVVTTEQNIYAQKTFFQRWTDTVLSFVSWKIIAVSQDVALFTAKQEHIPLSKFVLIHNGVNVDDLRSAAVAASIPALRQELDLANDEKLIINVGQFINQKNQALLIDAFKSFSENFPQFKLLILGEGALRSSLEERVQSSGLSGRVLLPGIKKSIAQYYAVSDFFVLSSRFEGFCTVVIEAMACGLPVISTRVAGSNESIREGDNGFLAESTAEDLAERMQQVACLDAEARRRFSEKAEQTARHYDMSVVVKKYQSLFLEACRR